MASDSKSDQTSGTDSAPGQAAAGVGAEVGRTSIGRYDLKKKIGAGGMGWVYLAFDTQRKMNVALKVLPRSKTSNEKLVERFKSEAVAARQLNHPNIVRTYDAGEDDGYLYIAMEYFKGTDVYQLVSRLKTLPVQRSISMVKQVVQALDHAFEKAIVHRDIKPSNLLVSRDGTVKLTDMGLARSIDESAEAGITRDGTTVGTVDYMSPEQARDSHSADVRSDIYSLACTWYHMLTGDPPFPHGSLTNKLFAHVSGPRPDPREKNPAIPKNVVEVMHKMMARRPSERYQTPVELLDALNALGGVDEQTLEEEVAEETFESTLRSAVSYETGTDFRTSKTPTAVRLPAPRRRKKRAPAWNFVDARFVVIAGIGVFLFAALYWAMLRIGDSARQETLNTLSTVSNRSDNDKTDPDVNDPDEQELPDWKQPTPPVNQGSMATVPQPPGKGAANAAQSRTQNSKVVSPEPQPQEPAPPPDAPWLPVWKDSIWPVHRDGSSDANANLTVVTVGRENGGPADFADLESALKKPRPKGRVVIQLVGAGPFCLPPVTLVNLDRIVLRGDPQQRSLVLLTTHYADSSDACLQLTGGMLVLEGIDLLLASDNFDPSEKLVAVRVVDGSLIARDCSVTLDGSRKTTAFAFEIAGTPAQAGKSPDVAPRVLLERTVIRGNGLAALSVQQSQLDLLATHCLFASGVAPVLHVTGGSSDAAGAAGSGEFRALRFVNCSSTSRSMAMRFENRQNAYWQGTTVFCRDSLFAAEQGAVDPVFVSLGSFSKSAAPAGGSSRAAGMQFQIDESYLCGWEKLVISQPDSGLRVDGTATWNDFWKTPGSSPLATPQRWPNPSIENFSQLQPAKLDTVHKDLGIDSANLKSFGCDLASLHVPDDVVEAHAVALSRRPLVPESIVGKGAKNIVTVQLGDDDLGREISRQDWPSGTEFLVTGSGSHESQPIRVTGRSFRIRFDSTASKSAKISPRNIDENAKGEAGRAFMYVKDANVEIVGGSFEIPPFAQKPKATCFLKLENGNFRIVDAVIQGPMNDGPAFDALIEWKNSRPGETHVLAGRYARHALIFESFLRGGRASVAARGAGLALTVDQSVLVNMESAVRFDVEGGGRSANSTIDVRNSTLSSVEQCVDARFGAVVTNDSPTLTLFADETFFAPPAGKPASGSTAVLNAPLPAREAGKLIWWGTGNGYAVDINSYFRPSGSPAAVDGGNFETAWLNGWGPGHEMRPLFQRDDVALRADLPDAGTIEPSTFEFAANVKAGTWTIDGYAIGAELSWFEMPVPTAVPKPNVPKPNNVLKPKDKPKTPERAKSAPRPNPIEGPVPKSATPDSTEQQPRKRGRDPHDKYN